MSTSSIDAKNELERASCSHADSDVSLDGDLVEGIFQRMVAFLPIQESLRLRTTCLMANRAISASLRKHEHIRIEVKEAEEFRQVGIRREKNPDKTPIVIVQGSRVTLSQGVQLIAKLLTEATVIHRLTLSIQDRDLSNLNALLTPFLDCEKVQLECLRVTRRDWGAPIVALCALIRKNASTLKYLGKIGLHEAALTFSSELHPTRCSLTTFDLGLEAPSTLVLDCLLRVAESGATFSHLSYTSFTGFDPTDDVVQRFIDVCQIRSMRLTMMRGPFVVPQPDYMLSKVRGVEFLELGEVVNKPNIFNSLVQYEKLFKKIFPNVPYITFFQQW